MAEPTLIRRAECDQQGENAFDGGFHAATAALRILRSETFEPSKNIDTREVREVDAHSRVVRGRLADHFEGEMKQFKLLHPGWPDILEWDHDDAKVTMMVAPRLTTSDIQSIRSTRHVSLKVVGVMIAELMSLGPNCAIAQILSGDEISTMHASQDGQVDGKEGGDQEDRQLIHALSILWNTKSREKAPQQSTNGKALS
jgi:hypothetical protein